MPTKMFLRILNINPPPDERGQKLCHKRGLVEKIFPVALETSSESSSNCQSNVAFEHRYPQPWALSAFPECGSVQYPIPDRSAVWSFAPYNGPRNAHELGPHLIAREPDLRIAM